MPLPDEGVNTVGKWIATLNASLPPHAASQLRYRSDAYRNAITLYECRSVDVFAPNGDWFEVPFARLRFTRSRGWELFWSDRNSDFHVYDQVEPTHDVAALLSEIDRDPTGIFFG